jgi:hypothetical protein
VRLPRGEYLLTAHLHVVVVVAAQTNWKKIAAEKKQAANKFSKVVEDDTDDGPLDMTIISPQGVNGNGPWHIIFVPNQTKADSFQVMLKFLKDYKGSKTNGWNFTYDRVSKVWYSMDNEGVPNALKLKDFLQDGETVAMFKDVRAISHRLLSPSLTRDNRSPSASQPNMLRSLTYRESKDGPKMDMKMAIKNSDEWEETDSPITIDDIPSIDDAEDKGSSSASGSATTTPKKNKEGADPETTNPGKKARK